MACAPGFFRNCAELRKTVEKDDLAPRFLLPMYEDERYSRGWREVSFTESSLTRNDMLVDFWAVSG